jgi:protease IV
VSALRRSTLGAALALGVVSTASAQLVVDRPTPLPAYGRSLVSNEDSTALVQNPANLAYLPGAELRWQGAFLDESALVPQQGHSFSLAAPVHLFGLGLGLRVDLLDPPSENPAARFRNNSRYQWLSAGIAKGTPGGSFGISYQHAYSENRLIDGMDSWSIGYTARPVNQLGLALVGHDINAPRSRAGGFLSRSYELGVLLRPASTQAFELGLEGKFIDASAPYWIPRATLGVDVPSLGRLRGEVSVSDPDDSAGRRAWLASVQMAFQMNGATGSMELAAGTTFGSGLGRQAADQAQKNLLLDVAFKSHREYTASEAPVHAVRIRLEDTPNNRDHVGLLRRLWNIADNEPSVAAVVLEIRTAPGGSLAHVQELRDAVWYLRKHGKRVLCHLEDADGASLYLCSAASRILVNPAGGIRFAGLRTRYYYARSLLEKLGVRADFVRIGEHKSAPEMFTRDGATEVSRADKIDLLQQFERFVTHSVASGRRIAPATLRERIARGPFIAEEAKKAGLVDGFAFDDELEVEAGKLVGFSVKLVDDDDRTRRSPGDFRRGRGVAVVYVDGDMVDGRSDTIPGLGLRMVGSYTIADTLKEVREDPRVASVVLRIESGGGSAMAADVIWRQVQLTARVKPVVVSMGSAAASGGYYIATPATRVFANPLTITGSIGIFYGKADIAELLRKIGVTVEVYKTAPRADAEAIYRPFTDEERTELRRKVGQFYEMFLSRVAEGRHLSKGEVDAAGQGRVWTGEQAYKRKLVDEVGGLRQALAEARRLAELPLEAPIVELPPREGSLLGKILGIDGVSAKPGLLLPPAVLDMARALAPFALHPPDRPLARIELMPVVE